MKHSEIYDKHDDHRKAARKPKPKPKKKGMVEDRGERLARVSFKNYVWNVRQAELEEELDTPLDDDQPE